jgi:hypothetical protein
MPEMSAQDGAEPVVSEDEFFERLRLEGVTITSHFFMPREEDGGTRFYRYDPGLVSGFDPRRDEDGDVVAQEVANHTESVIEEVERDHVEDVVFPKVRDGVGNFGLAVLESAEDEGNSGGDVVEYEPMGDDETLETIRRNYDKHGVFSEDDGGEQKVVSLAHPDAKLMGYITGSHVKSLPAESMETVDDYRNAVFQALGADLSDEEDAEPIVDFDSPDDVPIATDDMMETFEEAGNSIDDETREKLSRQVSRRWEDGAYDHLRGDEGDTEQGDED